jgi:hypothetical protein
MQHAGVGRCNTPGVGRCNTSASVDATRRSSADATRRPSADATSRASADATRRASADATRRASADATHRRRPMQHAGVGRCNTSASADEARRVLKTAPTWTMKRSARPASAARAREGVADTSASTTAAASSALHRAARVRVRCDEWCRVCSQDGTGPDAKHTRAQAADTGTHTHAHAHTHTHTHTDTHARARQHPCARTRGRDTAHAYDACDWASGPHRTSRRRRSAAAGGAATRCETGSRGR